MAYPPLAFVPAGVAHVCFFKLDVEGARPWTILQVHPPNHLGLRCNVLRGQQTFVILITSGCVCRPGFELHALGGVQVGAAMADGFIGPAQPPRGVLSLCRRPLLIAIENPAERRGGCGGVTVPAAAATGNVLVEFGPPGRCGGAAAAYSCDLQL